LVAVEQAPRKEQIAFFQQLLQLAVAPVLHKAAVAHRMEEMVVLALEAASEAQPD
jgi:hypothetical protein